jgi:hypothetical protein
MPVLDGPHPVQVVVGQAEAEKASYIDGAATIRHGGALANVE